MFLTISKDETYFEAGRKKVQFLKQQITDLLDQESINMTRQLTVPDNGGGLPLPKFETRELELLIQAPPRNSQSQVHSYSQSQSQVYSYSQSSLSSSSLPSSRRDSGAGAATGTAFEWRFFLKPMEPLDPRRSALQQSLVLGLIGVVDTLFTQRKELFDVIRRKDIVLSDIKDAYANSSYKPRRHKGDFARFVADAWSAQYLERRAQGADELHNVVERAIDTAQPIWGYHSLGPQWNRDAAECVGVEAVVKPSTTGSFDDDSFFDSFDVSFRPLTTEHDDKADEPKGAVGSVLEGLKRKRSEEEMGDSSGSETEDSLPDTSPIQRKKQKIQPAPAEPEPEEQPPSTPALPDLQKHQYYDTQEALFPRFSSQYFYSDDFGQYPGPSAKAPDLNSDPLEPFDLPSQPKREFTLPTTRYEKFDYMSQPGGSAATSPKKRVDKYAAASLAKLESAGSASQLNARLAHTARGASTPSRHSSPSVEPPPDAARKQDDAELEKQRLQERLERDLKKRRAKSRAKSRF